MLMIIDQINDINIDNNNINKNNNNNINSNHSNNYYYYYIDNDFRSNYPYLHGTWILYCLYSQLSTRSQMMKPTS